MTFTSPNGYARNWANPAGYSGSEMAVYVSPNRRVARSDPIVLLAHGLLSDAEDFLDLGDFDDDWRATSGLTKIATIVGDFGGAASWGNKSMVYACTKFLEAAGFAGTQVGPQPPYERGDTSRLIGYGQSMGAAGICNLAVRFPNLFQGLILLVPAVDLIGLRDDNVSSFASSINSAYGGASAFDALAPYWSPLEYAEQLVGIFGSHISVFYSTEDTAIPPDYVEPFAEIIAAGGGYVEDVGGDHADMLNDADFPQKLGVQIARLKAGNARSNTSRNNRTNEFGLAQEFKFWELIRDASAGVGTFEYMGGDVTDSCVLADGRRIWIGADWFAGSTVSALDYYNALALPFRNGLLIEGTDGVFTGQEFATGTSGNWINIDTGIYPNATHYWPIACMMEDLALRVGCWAVGTGGPYGDLQDSHIVTINTTTFEVTGAAVPFNAGDGRFWIEGFLDDGDYIYVYFEEFDPPYDADFANNNSVPNYGKGDVHASYTYHRVARVPTGSLTTVADYRWWNGSTWVADMDEAEPMVDTKGNLLSGDTGFCKLPNGRYAAATHQLVANHIKVYVSSTPTGPWTFKRVVPTHDMGTRLNGGIRIGQLTKLLPDLTSAPDTIMSLISMNNLDIVQDWPERHINVYAPRFVEIPYG